MSLIKSNTKWVLFLSSTHQPEDRHIRDLAFGLYCLESAGIKNTDIFIYVDGTDRKLISKWIDSGSKNKYTIKTSQDYFLDQNTNTHENMVMFVTGHGSISGIDATLPITPYALLKQIKSSPKLTSAVVYLGQCYAGIFNYVAAGRRTVQGGAIEPDVIFIGATDLHESMSSPTSEQLIANETWVANLFLLHVFKWFAAPVDVDGDGKQTIIDSYKYAGVCSNEMHKERRMTGFHQCILLHEIWRNAYEAYQKNKINLNLKVALDAAETRYNKALSTSHVHQECWILNSFPAQVIER